ncbi:MAG: sigma-70 family RNA polymerase sigma factor [Luteimonas sp.]
MAVTSEGIALDQDGLGGLLSDIAGGDNAAFERLYRSTSSKLFGICARIVSDRAEAEDTLQEVFTTIWHKAGQFDAARASAMTWLAMIARNKSIDRLRSNVNLRQNASIELAENLSDGSPTGLEATESADDQRRLNACMGELDADRQALLRTAFFEGVTYEELATRTSTPLGTVKSWIRRSLLKLKACLER